MTGERKASKPRVVGDSSANKPGDSERVDNDTDNGATSALHCTTNAVFNRLQENKEERGVVESKVVSNPLMDLGGIKTGRRVPYQAYNI